MTEVVSVMLFGICYCVPKDTPRTRILSDDWTYISCLHSENLTLLVDKTALHFTPSHIKLAAREIAMPPVPSRPAIFMISWLVLCIIINIIAFNEEQK